MEKLRLRERRRRLALSQTARSRMLHGKVMEEKLPAMSDFSLPADVASARAGRSFHGTQNLRWGRMSRSELRGQARPGREGRSLGDGGEGPGVRKRAWNGAWLAITYQKGATWERGVRESGAPRCKECLGCL